MIAKKYFSMDVLIDLAMTKLFLLAEYVCSKSPFLQDKPAVQQDAVTKAPVSPIRFSSKDNYVEGELFN